MDIDSAFVSWVLEQVRDGELDVESAAAMLSTHLEQCIDEALEDNEEGARLRARARELRERISRLEPQTRG